MYRVLVIFLLFFELFQSTPVIAQNPSYFHYDNEKGLPSDEVYSIVQDHDGMIWIGCEAGLFKFDGFRYHSYRSENEKSRSLTALKVAKDGKVYCLNFKNQIFHTDDKSNQLIEIKHPFNKVKHFDISNDGTLYVSHDKGLAKRNVENAEWTEIILQESDKGKKTGAIDVLKNNHINFLLPNGLGQIINGKHDFKSFGEDSKLISSEFILSSNLNSSWLFSFRRSDYYMVRGGSVEKNNSEILNELVKNRKVTNVQLLDDNTLWISTFKGCIIYNIDEDQGKLIFSDKAISKVLKDREGNYWFTTLQSGVLRVPNIDFLVWNTENSQIHNNRITHVARDDKNIYFSDINGHVGILNVRTGNLKSIYTGFDANIESICYNKYNRELLIHTRYHLLSYRDDQINLSDKEYAAIKKILTTPKRRYLATSSGLHIENTDSEVEYFVEGKCRDISFDSTLNELWLATNNGLLRYKQLKDTIQFMDTTLKNTFILDVEFHEKNIYALTYEGKIYSINEDDIKLFYQVPNQYQGRKFKIVNHIIYIMSNKGLLTYNTDSKEFNVLNRKSGLASNNVQGMVWSNEFIWLATGQGLQRIPSELAPTPPKALISTDLKQDITFQLNHDEPLKIRPQASTYKSNGEFLYAYRINQREWIELPGSIEEINLQNLPLRNIQIELKVIDHLGRDSQNEIILRGYVTPPVYFSWWFLSLAFITLVILTLLVVRKRISSIKQRQKQKNALLNSQLKAIRAQMNPHFMYNTLNSIQDLILQNDIKNTNYYLSKFSQLMRQILSFSEEEKILLSEEVEMLNNYLTLEKLRFGEDFKFMLEIDKTIDTHRTVIPSLILQPFVENAIKHGLLHKKGEKKLEIRFNRLKNKEGLEITVEDNGIGRKHSAEIKQRSKLNHKSFASNAVQKRIDLLNKGKQFTIDLSIEDLTDSSKATGTCVTIHISSST